MRGRVVFPASGGGASHGKCIPGVAVVTSTRQTADNKGDDTNHTRQTNPVSVKLPAK